MSSRDVIGINCNGKTNRYSDAKIVNMHCEMHREFMHVTGGLFQHAVLCMYSVHAGSVEMNSSLVYVRSMQYVMSYFVTYCAALWNARECIQIDCLSAAIIVSCIQKYSE